MADCNFSIEFRGSASDIVAKVQQQFQKQGGKFEGDDTVGSFSVSVLGSNIAGSYTITGSQLNVTIDSKPFFIGCGQIESLIKSQLGG